MTLQDPNCTIQSLNLGYNDIGPVGAEVLSAALQVSVEYDYSGTPLSQTPLGNEIRLL